MAETGQRYLRFSGLEVAAVAEPVNATCSLCERRFVGKAEPGEVLSDVVTRIRAEFEAHNCAKP